LILANTLLGIVLITSILGLIFVKKKAPHKFKFILCVVTIQVLLFFAQYLISILTY